MSACKSMEHPRLTSMTPHVLEIVGVLSVGTAVVFTGGVVWGGPVAMIISVWVANLAMMALIYWGLNARGQSWSHFGLSFRLGSSRSIGIAVLQSMAVFVFGVMAFAAGAILMANLVGMPEPADMSKYDYLRGNLVLTLLALASVYLVSSFAEEVIYRGYLITRLRELTDRGWLSNVIAVVSSSLVFGLVHSDWGIAGMVQASCMGVALWISYLAVKRNLWVVILAHAYMDTILILQMYGTP